MSDLTAVAVVKAIDDLLAENTRLKAQISAGATAKPNNRKKLGKQEVKSIRDLKRIGCSNKEIADVFDVNPGTISRIVRGIYHA